MPRYAERKCPFDGCKVLVPSERFACISHWRLLRKQEQAEVYGLYEAWQRADIAVGELRRLQRAVVERVQDRHRPAAALPTCRRCGRAVIYKSAYKVSFLSLDPEPSESGTVRLVGESGCEVLTHLEAAAFREGGGRTYRQHQATCPKADKKQ